MLDPGTVLFIAFVSVFAAVVYQNKVKKKKKKASTPAITQPTQPVRPTAPGGNIREV